MEEKYGFLEAVKNLFKYSKNNKTILTMITSRAKIQIKCEITE